MAKKLLRWAYLVLAASMAVAAPGCGRSAEEQSPATVDPRLQKAQQRERFQNDLREFFARAPTLSPEERSARARDIARDITRYEAEGEVAAAEALKLRTALVRETVEDPVEQMVAIRGLEELYQQQGAREQVK
jgi:hypothetical protein